MSPDELAIERTASEQRQAQRDAEYAAEHPPEPPKPRRRFADINVGRRPTVDTGPSDYVPPVEWDTWHRHPKGGAR